MRRKILRLYLHQQDHCNNKIVPLSNAFDRWRMPLVQSSAPITIAISVAYGVGFAVGQPWLISLLGAAVAIAILIYTLQRSPWHELAWRSSPTQDS